MKKILQYLITFFIITALVASAFNAFGQAQKTLIKSVQLEKGQEVYLALAGAVETEEWDKDYIRIETSIEIANSGESILERLSALGRYGLTAVTNDDGELEIDMPKIKNTVTVKGEVLLEMFRFKVQVPRKTSTRVMPPETMVF